jgi:hypothetical protein
MACVTAGFLVINVARSLRIHFAVGDFLALTPLLALLATTIVARAASIATRSSAREE